MKALIFALVCPLEQKSDIAASKLRELTIAWSRYGYRGEIIEDNSIDRVLSKAVESGHQFCLVQGCGHVIDEQWYLSHWEQEGFHKGIRRLMQSDEFLVIGEWFVSHSGCVGINGDCLLVNLNRYKDLGQPEFGESDNLLRKMPQHQTLPADESVLLPSESISNQTVEQASDAIGWNFIQVSLQNNLPIRCFNHSINDNRFNLIETDNNTNFLRTLGKPVDHFDDFQLLSQAQSTFIERIKQQIMNAQKGAFLFNIESYNDLNEEPKSSGLDGLFSVAAGFKPYRILYSQGHHERTNVVFFDYSKKALDIRQRIAKEWDGDDFPHFIRYLFKTHPHPEVFYQLWYGVTPETLDWSDMDELWQNELDKWGGAACFKNCWLSYKKLPHQYLHCDLLQDKAFLLSKVAQFNNSYIWWSNAFFTIFSHWHYSSEERRGIYIDWITELAKVAPDCRINGADHNNMAVNGYSAKQYFQLFDQYHCDELKPQRLHDVEIQF